MTLPGKYVSAVRGFSEIIEPNKTYSQSIFLCHKPHTDIFSCYFINQAKITKNMIKQNPRKQTYMGKEDLRQGQQSRHDSSMCIG